jgi:hypothetical protein
MEILVPSARGFFKMYAMEGGEGWWDGRWAERGEVQDTEDGNLLICSAKSDMQFGGDGGVFSLVERMMSPTGNEGALGDGWQKNNKTCNNRVRTFSAASSEQRAARNCGRSKIKTGSKTCRPGCCRDFTQKTLPSSFHGPGIGCLMMEIDRKIGSLADAGGEAGRC